MTKITIYSWNVNGIRAATKKGLKEWIEKVKPDVLGLQEIKASEEQIPKSLIPDSYNIVVNSAEKKGYSGVLTCSRIPVKSSKTIFGIEEFDSEGRIIETKYDEFTLLNVYFPNGKKNDERLDYKMRFYDFFLNYIKKLREAGERVVFCGDVNTAHKEIDLANPKPNSKYSGFLPKEREWIDKVIAEDFIDTFREFDKSPERYSWWSVRSNARARNVGWRIDYFFVDRSLLPNLKKAEIHMDVMGSDHCPISITLEF